MIDTYDCSYRSVVALSPRFKIKKTDPKISLFQRFRMLIQKITFYQKM